LPLHFPRFRALAVFGRRPPCRVVSSSLPASENLHRSGPRLHRSKMRRLRVAHWIDGRVTRQRRSAATALRGRAFWPLQIDDKIERGRAYHGQVCRLLTLEGAGRTLKPRPCHHVTWYGGVTIILLEQVALSIFRCGKHAERCESNRGTSSRARSRCAPPAIAYDRSRR
jgi:hypothetical protein